MKVGLLAASLIFILFACAIRPQPKKEISELEAIRSAEEFIVDNGYTDLPPSEDKSKLKCESVYCGLDEWSMENIRHNSLLRNAYGVKNLGEGSWMVVFHYNCDHLKFRRTISDSEEMCKTRGRAVTMDVYGNSLQMAHQNCYLEFNGLRKIAQ
jgi:hypothetical protein